MRLLWTNELITYEGQDHRITDAGLNPLPVQQPIPVWFGGHADAVLRRTARIGDGWFPLFAPDDEGAAEVEKFRGYIREAGRDPAEVGIETWLDVLDKTPDQWRAHAAGWKKLGATHYSVNTMNSGLASPQAHIESHRSGSRTRSRISEPWRHCAMNEGREAVLGEDERAFLDGQRVAHLATVDGAGIPNAGPVCFTVAGDSVYMTIDRKPKSGRPLKRLRNIAENPHVALTADHYDDDDWTRGSAGSWCAAARRFLRAAPSTTRHKRCSAPSIGNTAQWIWRRFP